MRNTGSLNRILLVPNPVATGWSRRMAHIPHSMTKAFDCLARRVGSMIVALAVAHTLVAGARAESTQDAWGPAPGDESYYDGDPDQQAKRNVLLIIADDVGVDQIGRYVDFYNTNTRSDDDITTASVPCTPTLDALAGAGVTFLNAWSSPTCSPTRAGVYTGTHAFRHGVYSPVLAESFSRDTTTVAEALEDAGYRSGLFGKWHLGETYIPTYHGWGHFAGSPGGHLDSYYDWDKTVSTRLSVRGAEFVRTSTAQPLYATYENSADAVDWINRQPGRWMATVAFNAAHTVMGATGWTFRGQAPPSGTTCSTWGASDQEIFHATIEAMDFYIGELLAGIGSSKLARTTIIFVGDNGTEQSMSDQFGRGVYTDANAKDVNHAKATVYEGGVNVPLIIADGYSYLNPGQESSSWYAPTGRVVDPGRFERALVQTLDLYATAAEIAGADATCGVDSVSLVPLLSNTATKVREASYAETDLNQAVRTLSHKLVARTDGSGTKYELYELFRDRWEHNDLLAPYEDYTTSPYSLIVDALLDKIDRITSVPDACP